MDLQHNQAVYLVKTASLHAYSSIFSFITQWVSRGLVVDRVFYLLQSSESTSQITMNLMLLFDILDASFQLPVLMRDLLELT